MFVFPAGSSLSLAFYTSATSTAATIAVPAEVVGGDLMVLYDVAGGTPGSVTPTGWTLINSAASGAVRAVISYRIATNTDAGASVTGMDSTAMRKAMLVFRGPVVAVSVSSVGSQGTDANPAAQTVLAASGTPPLIVFGGYSCGNNPVDPRTFTVASVAAKDGEVFADTKSYLAYKIYNSNPADVVIDMNNEGNNNLLNSFYLACTG